jgi:hypothetical protein
MTLGHVASGLQSRKIRNNNRLTRQGIEQHSSEMEGDLIVLDAYGHNALKHALPGSITERLIAR